ncbi:MAG: hypothetical protein LBV33_05210, partial [Lachnospiraceae bacterium]|nr:hypothetical protein [Lachnospiraceae bacterium]
MDKLALRDDGKRRLRKVLYVYIAVIMVLIFCSKTIYNYSLPRVTVVMPNVGRLNKELLAHGVIEYAETIDLCADNAGRIDQLLVHEGDIVTAGMAIAQLADPIPDAVATYEAGLAGERIDNRLAVLALSRTDLQNKRARLQADPAELLPYKNAITDAQTALNRAQDQYDQALSIVRDGHSAAAEFVQAVADAEREWSKRRSELQNAEEELARIESEGGESLEDDELPGGGETPVDGEQPGGGETPVDGEQPGGGETPVDGGNAGDGENREEGETVGNNDEEWDAAKQKCAQAKVAVEDAEYAYNRAVS